MEPTRISVDEVKVRLDRGEKIIFLDVRNRNAWNLADTKLPGAIRIPVDEISQHLHELPQDKTCLIVAY